MMYSVPNVFEVRPYASPAPPPLPEFCASEAVPFSSTGVDFAGLPYIRTYGLTKNKMRGFVYIPVVSPEQLV